MSSLHNPTFADFLEENKKNVIIIVIIILLFVLGFLLFSWQTESFIFANQDQEVSQSDVILDHNLTQGNTESDLIFVEFFDYECPACQSFSPIINSFVEERGDEIAVVHRHFPTIGTYSLEAARATQAAQKQNKGVEFKNQVYSRVASQNMTINNLTAIAEEIGLDVQRWDQDRRSREIRDQVQADENFLKNIRLPESSRGSGTRARATPSVLIVYKGEIKDWFSGAIPLQDLNNFANEFLGVENTPQPDQDLEELED